MKTQALSNISDLRKLIILRTIVETGSLRKAASSLKVTPSAVSQTLSAFEKQIGKPMVIREKGCFKVTLDCEELLKKMEPTLKALDAFTLDEHKKVEMARLDLGTYESLAVDILPQFIKKVRVDHPGVKLNFVINRSTSILQKIRSGELCTGLVVETDEIDSFQTETIFEDDLSLFVSADSEYAHQGWKAVEELGLGCLATGREGPPRYYLKFMKSLGKLKPLMTSDSFEVLREAAVQGSAVCVLPKRVANRHKGQLVEITERPEPNGATGRHKIVVAYLDRCDQGEATYLADSIRSISAES